MCCIYFVQLWPVLAQGFRFNYIVHGLINATYYQITQEQLYMELSHIDNNT